MEGELSDFYDRVIAPMVGAERMGQVFYIREKTLLAMIEKHLPGATAHLMSLSQEERWERLKVFSLEVLRDED